MGIFDGFFTLGSNTNKTSSKDEERREGAFELLPELELTMDDEDLIKLKKEWEKLWNKVAPKISKAREINEKYWVGKQFSESESNLQSVDPNYRPLVDNKIFEALETFLPIATRQNPDPVVSADDTEEGKELAGKTRKMLIAKADEQRLKLRIKRAVRYWSLYFLGVAKVGYSYKKDDIVTEIIRPQKLILDPTATINDDMEYTGEFIGERKKEKASSLILRFPKSKDVIEKEVKDKMGTQIAYIEWWTDEYVFWTMKDEVLEKAKNPHWNEDTSKDKLDSYGNKEQTTVAGNNHFTEKKKPYIFLSVFNLGQSPFDETSLISQNLALQDLVNKRQKQIDKNVDGMNGGWIISGERSGLTREQATEAIKAVRKGGGLFIESGNPNEAVARTVGTSIPADVYNQLADSRLELQNIFGVAGSTAEGIKSEQTVRGKIITREGDATRIGGGITEYIEQFADQIYNWWVQLMFVYYTEEKTASIVGEESAREFVALRNTAFNKSLTVSVKEGSLIPKDPLTQRNEAVDLFQAGAMDPITLYDKLEYPNPRKAAERAFLWTAAPAELFNEERDDSMDLGALVAQKQQGQVLEEEATRRAVDQTMPIPTATPTQGKAPLNK